MSALKSVAKATIPAGVRSSLRGTAMKVRHLTDELERQWQIWSNRGDRFECPCCGGRFDRFLTYGVIPRPNVLCPQCGSLERHRLLWLYLKNRTNLFDKPLKLLHMAPEPWFQEQFKQVPGLDYVSADLMAEWAMEKVDITDMPFEDNTFDAILCNHVLEHIPDDRTAMTELLRVLVPGGWAILQVPLDLSRDTFEDPSITDPQERERLFGQKDHVRMYGKDYADRLRAAGFEVNVDNYASQLKPEEIDKYRISPQENIYFCTKPV